MIDYFFQIDWNPSQQHHCRRSQWVSDWHHEKMEAKFNLCSSCNEANHCNPLEFQPLHPGILQLQRAWQWLSKHLALWSGYSGVSQCSPEDPLCRRSHWWHLLQRCSWSCSFWCQRGSKNFKPSQEHFVKISIEFDFTNWDLSVFMKIKSSKLILCFTFVEKKMVT